MVSPQYFFVREIEQMNYFCSAYPEVVKGEVGQSHAGDVFWELLQDLRVLCLQVDKKKYRSVSLYTTPPNPQHVIDQKQHIWCLFFMLVLVDPECDHICRLVRPLFRISEGLSMSGGCGTGWETFCVLERFQRCNLSESLWLHWIHFWFRFGVLSQECAAPAN